MLDLVRHCRACSTPSKITKCHYLWEWWSYFVCLLHLVTRPWKLQYYHFNLVGYGPACPKFSDITNCQYLRKWLSDFVDFLHVVIRILLDIIEATEIYLFGLSLLGIGSQSIRLSDVLNLKNSKTIWIIFASIEATKRIMLFCVMTPKYSRPISFQDFLLLTCLTC